MSVCLTKIITSDERAREIAAYFQTSRHGDPFAVFASTGTVTDDLDRDIRAEELAILQDDKPDYAAYDNLAALRRYVRTLTVTVWHIGSNIAGYLPASVESVTHVLDYVDAVDAYRSMLESAADDYASHVECDCEAENGESCEYHSTDGCAQSMINDGVPSGLWRGQTADVERNISHWINIDNQRVEFWLTRESMTYGAFVSGYYVA